MGYVFTIPECTVSWKAKLQDIVALSTTRAEHMNAVEASKEPYVERIAQYILHHTGFSSSLLRQLECDTSH